MRAALALLNLIKAIVVKIGPQDQRKQFAGEWAAHDKATDEQWRSLHRQYLFMNVGQALSQWAGMEELLVAIASLLLSS